jgi:hypothetical protein
VIGAMLFRKGAAMVAAGENDAGWRQIIEAVRVYHDAPASVSYFHSLRAATLIMRATVLVKTKPPTDELRGDLLSAAQQAVMPQAAMCVGFQEELLAAAAVLFFGHLEPLRAELVVRWGTPYGAVMTDERMKTARPSPEAWKAFRAVWDPVAARCATTAPRTLHAELKEPAAALVKAVPSASQLVALAMDHLRWYGDLVAAEDQLRKQLTVSPAPPSP